VHRSEKFPRIRAARLFEISTARVLEISDKITFSAQEITSHVSNASPVAPTTMTLRQTSTPKKQRIDLHVSHTFRAPMNAQLKYGSDVLLLWSTRLKWVTMKRGQHSECRPTYWDTSICTVAARRSVAPEANVRPAEVPADYGVLGAPHAACVWRNPAWRWIWCILNGTERLWWTDIRGCVAFKWSHKGQIFFVFLEMSPSLESDARGACPLRSRSPRLCIYTNQTSKQSYERQIVDYVWLK